MFAEGVALVIGNGAYESARLPNPIIPLTYLEATQGRGVLASPDDVIAQASDLGSQSSITITLDYGLASKQRGFGLSTDRDMQASNSSPATNAKHGLNINLLHAELQGEAFGRVTRVSIQLNNIPPQGC